MANAEIAFAQSRVLAGQEPLGARASFALPSALRLLAFKERGALSLDTLSEPCSLTEAALMILHHFSVNTTSCCRGTDMSWVQLRGCSLPAVSYTRSRLCRNVASSSWGWRR